MKIGEYWTASSSEKDDETEWLFVIVATTVVRQRRYFLGLKCDWTKREPDWLPELSSMPYNGAWWFDSKGLCTDEEAPFAGLGQKVPGSGREFVRTPTRKEEA